jgi:hypothetical protein
VTAGRLDSGTLTQADFEQIAGELHEGVLQTLVFKITARVVDIRAPYSATRRRA